MNEIMVKYHNPDLTRITSYDKGDWIDLRSAEEVHMKAGEFKLISLGISIKIPEMFEMWLAPRSSTFKKFGIIQTNSIGIIDSDYYDNESNEGHFYFQYYNFNKEELHVKKGDVIGQVIFMKFLTCDDDCANGIRTGGFGSTDK